MKQSIGFKLGFWFSVLAILAAGTTGYYAYHQSRGMMAQAAEERLLTSTRVLSRRFSTALETISDDVLLIARLPFVQQLMTDQGAPVPDDRKTHIAEILEALLAEHPEYFQVRVIGAANHGLELIRIDRELDGLKRVPAAALQEKAHYPYVFRTLRLPPGSLYLSEISINREDGSHVGMNKPAIQIATPIAVDAGAPPGLVVINVDLDGLLQSMGADLPKELQLYLTNMEGDYLIHPDNTKTYGFDHGRRFLVQEEFLQAGQLIRGAQRQIILTTENSNAEDDLVAAFVRLPFGAVARERFILLGLAAPLKEVHRNTLILGQTIVQIVVGASLLAVMISFLLSRALSRPLLQVVAAIERFPATDPKGGSLPVGRKDEIGLLARSILKMTDQIRQQLALLEKSERSLNKAQETALIGNWELDLTTGQALWSDQEYRLLGYRPGESKGNLFSFLHAVHPQDRKWVLAELRHLREHDDESSMIEHRLQLSDGSVRVVEERAEVMLDGQARPVRLFGTTLDITDRKRVENQLRLSHEKLRQEAERRNELIVELEAKNAELERFTYTVSHDLKSPLVTVNGFLGLLEKDAMAGAHELVKRDVAQIKDATRQMGRLLEELLELSRIGRISNMAESVSLEKLTREAMDLIAGAIEKSGARISLDPGLPVIWGDRQRLLEVMQNLLENAIKFSRPNETPEVRISGRRENDSIVCCVCDNGIGIDARFHDRVFGLFEKLDPRIEGTGIGLALVKRIIEVQNGKVWIEQEECGQGSRLCFSLPNGEQGRHG